MSRATYKRNKEDFPLIVERDGYRCLYCPEPFTANHPPEYEHLDNNPDNNEIWNKTFAHHECNNRKKLYGDLQILAREKIESNKKYVYVCERMDADLGTTEHLTSCQAIHKINYPLAEQFIQEHTLVDGNIILKDGVNAITNLCFDNNQTGSQSAVYRYIDSLCNPINGKYTLSTNSQGKTIIRRRTEN